MLVDAANGEEIAWQVVPYSNGVMDRQLPGGTPLGPDVALQDAADYLSVLTEGFPRFSDRRTPKEPTLAELAWTSPRARRCPVSRTARPRESSALTTCLNAKPKAVIAPGMLSSGIYERSRDDRFLTVAAQLNLASRGGCA